MGGARLPDVSQEFAIVRQLLKEKILAGRNTVSVGVELYVYAALDHPRQLFPVHQMKEPPA